ncbi:MAG TPA: tRNA (adenosine(37)-N6)-threonylcarbamoyltransferase complex ATPase subunit type 1 TsaE [Thermoanaerobaculia bacterium]|jgi:tRNA threonylcarbamoyladenosine biosynthesis protein TsaE|nr:tRNA (adenosine(37)-N6)-threonylcarbamoyltransferase complex ATPase subunit type 1 TsaE [Thermoanaerobaculia bacterium]
MTRSETVTRSAAETEALGERLAASLSEKDVVYLEGDLGAGKTAFARGLARGLGAAEREVASPTFALLHEYAGADGGIVLRHLDLYRLSDSARELEVLGLPDSVSGAPVCVEWPRVAVRGLLAPTVEIRIQTEPGGESRRVSIAPSATRRR